MPTRIVIDSIDSSLEYNINSSYTFVLDKIDNLIRGNLGYAKFYLVDKTTAIIPARLAQNSAIRIIGDKPFDPDRKSTYIEPSDEE